jgi:energy-coupling factor transport system substrate-specific component
VSWQIVSFVLLGAVLLAGGIWYERSRPSAKVVAMVAALAALAVAGRVALAPIPNVVATTDIVLLTGYAIAGAPGFAVGSLAALVSNFWLGQGPWTPWQMAAWGAVGVGGAVLARFTDRRLGRLGLAFWCGLAGLAYGAVLDYSVMATYGGEQSLDRYLVLSARGLPFNIAHALGNVVFAMIAGPALVRMLLRFRARIEVTWRDAGAQPAGAVRGVALGALMVAAVLAGGVASRSPAAAWGAAAGAGAGSAWLRSAQNPDGGFGTTPGSSSSVEMTVWAALALEASGENPIDAGGAGASPIDYLRRHAGEIRATNDVERAILALEAAGIDSSRFQGHDLRAALLRRRAADGSFKRWPNLTAAGVVALAAAGAPQSQLEPSIRWLIRAQNSDGGWGAVTGAPSDPDSAGSVLQALAAGHAAGGAPARAAVSYLRRTQLRDGGWSLTPGGASNAQSTAYAIQGLVAAGVDPAHVARAKRNGLDYLAARQAGDGHYRYSAASDQTPVWVTAQALVAVHRAPFPLASVARASTPQSNPQASGTHPAAQASAPSAATPSNGSEGPAPTGGAQSRSGAQSGPAKPGPGTGSAATPPAAASNSATTPMANAATGSAPASESSGDGGLPGGTVAAIAGVVALVAAAGLLWYRRRLS